MQALFRGLMATYSFVTIWKFQAPIEQVWHALNDAESFPKWWPNIGESKVLPRSPGGGARVDRVVRGRVPCALRYATTVTLSDPPRELIYDAVGDLVGRGRMVLEPKGEWTEVTMYWDVSTSGFWLNLLAPLFRWLFGWNHNY